jgi:hypothetical protein
MFTPGEAAAVCYGDIFDFPLTKDELEKFTIAVHSGRRAGIYKNNMDRGISRGILGTRKSDDDIQFSDGFYFLKKRNKLVELRKNRMKYSAQKLEIAQKMADFIRFIPTVQMIVVTGALAMENCNRDDDIDLLVVSSRGTVWTTRFFVVVLLELLGKRRRPKDSSSSNKICLNMFLDEAHLKIPKNEQDIFAAHEVAQVKVLWGREDVIGRFWKDNEWVKNYLPNAYKNFPRRRVSKHIHHSYVGFMEPFFRSVQLMYMRGRRTNEVIQQGYLRFHPSDARDWVMPEYKKRLARVGLK